MYLTTPPCTEVEIAIWWQTCRCGTGTVHSTRIENADGVRFNDLFSATICMTGTHKPEREGSEHQETAKRLTSLDGFWKLYEMKAGEVVRMGETTCMFLKRVKVDVNSSGAQEKTAEAAV